jgi:RNA polymerase sigma-70 factor (ECF subfamily)
MASQSGTRLAVSGVDSDLSIMECHAVTTAPMLAPEDDSALVYAAREGDRSAFGGLYAKYARMVHGVLLARVPPGDVDDLVQDVFLRAMPRLRDLRDARKFGPWICAIARNIASDFYRQTKPIAEVTESLSEDEAESPAAGSVSDAEAAMILECVRQLPEAYRETMVLRLVEGMSGPEIASRTGLTPGSVRVNLHRGMQQLREKLSRGSSSDVATPDGGASDAAPGSEKSLLRRRIVP